MDPGDAQIRLWAKTGRHTILTGYENPNSDRTETNSSDLQPPDVEISSDNNSSTTPTTSLHVPEKLVGADGDSLIPESTEIDRVFHEGRRTWMQFVESARSLPQNSLPAGLDDPSVMLKDVPALPEHLPKHGVLFGQPLWHVPDVENSRGDGASNEAWDLEYLYGVRKGFPLSFPTPIECRASSRVGFCYYGSSKRPDCGHGSATPRGLLLLTLCWSYILSVRFWELQGKTTMYTEDALRPKLKKDFSVSRDNINIRLRTPASHKLIKWLCAVLAPKPGWCAKEGGFAPWAAFCSGDIQISISTDEPITFSLNERPPNSVEATELLIELCNLYGLVATKKTGGKSNPLPPVTAAFLAALALPFYRSVELQPQFPVPVFRGRPRTSHVEPEPIRQLVADLRYYMTLSMHPRSIGSIIWSIFWQPEIKCNVASPWLSSILSVLKPIIEVGDLDILAKAFTFRRPRAALWWFGIFLLGNSAISDFIVRYLETLEERYGYGSMSPPDTTVSAWTGLPQSFLDEETSHVYADVTDPVPRAELLKHRYNFCLQDTSSAPLSWRPFGVVPKGEIELDLWPWLEHRYTRTYVNWVWWIKTKRGIIRDVQHGFRNDTCRFVADVSDRLDMIHLDQVPACNSDLNIEPSREATLRMVNYCIRDMTGDRDREISTIPGAREHPWLEGWRGLE